ncbi:MAG: type II secretion system protein [Chloroflexi bacterium]|nr:type II secretion system protein [Chloroflexota bacterium]
MKEKGFAVLELLVAIAIVAILAGGISSSFFQTVRVTRQNNDMAAALRQAQNTGDWLSRDTMMGETIQVVNPPVAGAAFVTIGWNQWETGDNHTVRYIWLDSADARYRIRREYSVLSRAGTPLASASTYIADNIDTLDYSPRDGAWKLTVAASSGQQSVLREYQVFPRINADG